MYQFGDIYSQYYDLLYSDKDYDAEVNFDVFIEDKNKKVLIEKKETHNMRYFFDKELEHICKEIGFEINKKYKWMTTKSPISKAGMLYG
tara:strand:- start:24 stop:290 length:267 start_codon:yes stop_codon:yes gene_type:complete